MRLIHLLEILGTSYLTHHLSKNFQQIDGFTGDIASGVLGGVAGHIIGKIGPTVEKLKEAAPELSKHVYTCTATFAGGFFVATLLCAYQATNTASRTQCLTNAGMFYLMLNVGNVIDSEMLSTKWNNIKAQLSKQSFLANKPAPFEEQKKEAKVTQSPRVS